MTNALIRTLRGENVVPRPLWLMRQAGRYLPEYRALRAEKGGFLDLVYDHEAAAEVTLQPLRRFGFDGAILFSDILIVPHAMGQKLEFLTGEGPKLSPPLVESELAGLSADPSRYDPVYQTVRLCRDQLAPDVTMLSFAGSPWTVATYMIAGEGSRDQHVARAMAYADPGKVEAIIGAIIDQTVGYLRGQIDAGAEAVQLFDSWAGSLAGPDFDDFAIAPARRIIAALNQRHPGIPVIAFPRGAAQRYVGFARATGADCVALDTSVSPEWAVRNVQIDGCVQGNLDPRHMVTGGRDLIAEAQRITRAFRGGPHVFNLGHGITPEADPDNVAAMIEAVRSA